MNHTRHLLMLALLITLTAFCFAAVEQPLPGGYEGIALPNQQVQLTAPLQGIFEKAHVREGEHVDADALIAEMKSDQQRLIVEAAKLRAESDAAVRHAQYALEEAQILLDQSERILTTQAASEWEVRRQRVLRDQAQAELDQASAERDEAQVAYKLEQQRLDEHQLRAPFRGVITQIIRDPGSTVEQSEPLIVLADLATLKAEVYLPAAVYDKLKLNETYTLHAGPPVGCDLDAVLTFVNPVIDPASQTIRCTFRIDNADGKLPAGFHVRVIMR